MAMSSIMLPLRTEAPDFKLLNPEKNIKQSLNELKGDSGTIVVFICNHCPYVIHIAPKLSELSRIFKSQGISVIAVNPNDIVSYPEDSPERMIEFSNKYGFNFPYLFDETQETARAYKAACTPDFFLFDKEMKLVYRGQFDNARPSNGVTVTGNNLKDAVDKLLAGIPISDEQIPSIGCSIKWKA